MQADLAQLAPASSWQYGRSPTVLDLARNTAVSRAARVAAHALVRTYLGAMHGFAAHNAGQLADLSGCLIVANHASHLDAPALLSAWPLRQVNRVRSLCAKDYFTGRPWRWTMSFMLGNTIPMDRTRFDRRAFAMVREELAAGRNVIVFPEGTRSLDGRVHPFKAGIGLMAVKCGAAVLPAYVRGTSACCGRGAWWPRPGPVDVSFDRPVRYVGLVDCKHNWASVARDLQRRVEALAARVGKERTEHEYRADPHVEDAGAHGGAPQRRRSSGLRSRAHRGQDAGLRVS